MLSGFGSFDSSNWARSSQSLRKTLRYADWMFQGLRENLPQGGGTNESSIFQSVGIAAQTQSVGQPRVRLRCFAGRSFCRAARWLRRSRLSSGWSSSTYSTLRTTTTTIFLAPPSISRTQFTVMRVGMLWCRMQTRRLLARLRFSPRLRRPAVTAKLIRLLKTATGKSSTRWSSPSSVLAQLDLCSRPARLFKSLAGRFIFLTGSTCFVRGMFV